MTGSVQMLAAAGGGRAQGFTASLVNTSLSTGTRSAGFTLVNDGTSTTSASPAGGTQSCSAWFSPAPTTGAGSLYWAKFTTGSSTNTTITGTVGSVISLSAGAAWSFANSATNQEGVGNATVSIYSDSGGTNLIATGSVSWDVGFTP